MKNLKSKSYLYLLAVLAVTYSPLAKADGEKYADAHSKNDRFSYNEDESPEAQYRREAHDGANIPVTPLGERQVAARKRLLQPKVETENREKAMGCVVTTDSNGIGTYNCPADDEETDEED